METTTPKEDRASTVDIVLACLIPFIGLVIGPIAIARGQKKRGRTMLTVAAIVLALWFLKGFLFP